MFFSLLLQRTIRTNNSYSKTGLQALSVMRPYYPLPHFINTSSSYTHFYTGAVVIPLPVMPQGQLRNWRIHRVVQCRLLVMCPSCFKRCKSRPAWVTQTPIPNRKCTNNSLIQMHPDRLTTFLTSKRKPSRQWQGLCFVH
jgi:hypothetical protein